MIDTAELIARAQKYSEYVTLETRLVLRELTDAIAAQAQEIERLTHIALAANAHLNDAVKANEVDLSRVRALLAALKEIDTYSWSALTADCPEAGAELMRRVNVCRAAIRLAKGMAT